MFDFACPAFRVFALVGLFFSTASLVVHGGLNQVHLIGRELQTWLETGSDFFNAISILDLWNVLYVSTLASQ